MATTRKKSKVLSAKILNIQATKPKTTKNVSWSGATSLQSLCRKCSSLILSSLQQNGGGGHKQQFGGQGPLLVTAIGIGLELLNTDEATKKKISVV